MGSVARIRQAMGCEVTFNLRLRLIPIGAEIKVWLRKAVGDSVFPWYLQGFTCRQWGPRSIAIVEEIVYAWI
jgi:hypothetical protein